MKSDGVKRKRGRPPLGERAMTVTERVRKHRALKRAKLRQVKGGE